MFRFEHRLSKDIAFFIRDVQWLGFITPRLNDVIAAMVEGYEEHANSLKLILPAGDIDFVAAATVTSSEPVEMLRFQDYSFPLETTEEILAKKLFYRPESFKPRDVFDLAVAIDMDPSSAARAVAASASKRGVLTRGLRHLSDLGDAELARDIVPIGEFSHILAGMIAKVDRFVNDIPRLRENPKTPLAKRRDPDSTERMIRPGFLDIELRQNLIELARDWSAAHRLARRANALVLLDDGMSCEAIAKVLLLDDDTIRTWYRLYEGDGIEGLTNFSYEGSACQLSGEQQEKLKAWVATALPRTTRQVGAWIENEFGVVYEGRSGLIALLHRLGLEYHKPNVIPRKLDEEKQRAFIEGYEKLLNSLGDDEAVLFADAVHPTHAARPVGCWAPSQEKLAIEQTSGRQRINIHGAIDLETGQTRMIEALTIDAASTIRLLQSIEALYPMLALIHVFLDNARYHHAKLVQEWLALPGRRIKLHFIPTYCPHLNPIERLWGLMHRNVTHNKCYATCAQFADATLSFLREKVPGNWADLCDSVTDNFRIINPKDFRVMT